MKGTISLSQPISLSGEECWELDYDTDKVTAQQFIDADFWLANRSAMSEKVNGHMAETDTSFALALGIMAVIALRPTTTLDEYAGLAASDAMKFVRVGRVFTLGPSEEDSAGGSAPTDEESTRAGEYEDES